MLQTFDFKEKNQKVCLDFATEHILWTEKQWNMVHFSDESKFNWFGSDGKRFVRGKNGECLSPQCIKKTVKFGGGSVMLWGMISLVQVGPIFHFHGTIYQTPPLGQNMTQGQFLSGV